MPECALPGSLAPGLEASVLSTVRKGAAAGAWARALPVTEARTRVETPKTTVVRNMHDLSAGSGAQLSVFLVKVVTMVRGTAVLIARDADGRWRHADWNGLALTSVSGGREFRATAPKERPTIGAWHNSKTSNRPHSHLMTASNAKRRGAGAAG